MLGEGSFGAVVQRRKMSGEMCDYAVKVASLQANGGRDAEILATEARVLRLASGHDNVLRMLATFVVDDHACMRVDLATGDLYDYVRKLNCRGERMPEREGFLYAKQLAAAVAWLHQCGVAHRDIKLENVLLMGPGHAVIADLGLGVELSTLAYGLSDAFCGTSTTMAPEVYSCRLYDPRAADMFSLGATVLALLAPHEFGVYAWSVADVREAPEYGQYETLLDDYTVLRNLIDVGLISWPAEVPQPTAIEGLLRSSDAHHMPKQLPPALLLVLDGMLRPEPCERITAAEVCSHLVLLLE